MAFTDVTADSLAEPLIRPFASEASVASLPPRLLQLLPAGAQVAGWELHPLRTQTFARRTGMLSRPGSTGCHPKSSPVSKACCMREHAFAAPSVCTGCTCNGWPRKHATRRSCNCLDLHDCALTPLGLSGGSIERGRSNDSLRGVQRMDNESLSQLTSAGKNNRDRAKST